MICNILKSFVSFSIEIIVNNSDKIELPLITTFLYNYLYLAMDIKTSKYLSNELYIFDFMNFELLYLNLIIVLIQILFLNV